MPPCWCFPGDFFKFSKLISSQKLTKYSTPVHQVHQITIYLKKQEQKKNICDIC